MKRTFTTSSALSARPVLNADRVVAVAFDTNLADDRRAQARWHEVSGAGGSVTAR
ncbi:MAG: hypothetical protein ACLPVY_16330 [Acidimicrobiia bacterium]